MTTQERIDAFLVGDAFAVVGASTNRAKYGNKVLRVYLQRGRTVYPINPRASEIEGRRAYPSLTAAPQPLHGVSLVTPPEITEQVVAEGLALGIRHFWMQPGAESAQAVALAEAAGANVIAGGPCILVTLGFRDQ
jgi:predicted CoA-binding protein